jgi:hypothetical protein
MRTTVLLVVVITAPFLRGRLAADTPMLWARPLRCISQLTAARARRRSEGQGLQRFLEEPVERQGRELGGVFTDGASGVPATGQCLVRDGGSFFGTCRVSGPDGFRASLLIVVQASSAAAKDAPAATVMATGKPAAILAGSSKAEPDSPAASGSAATAII